MAKVTHGRKTHLWWLLQRLGSVRCGGRDRQPRVHILNSKVQNQEWELEMALEACPPEPPQTAPPTGDQVFKFLWLWGCLIETITPHKPTDLSLIPGTEVKVEGEKWLHKDVLSLPCAHHHTCSTATVINVQFGGWDGSAGKDACYWDHGGYFGCQHIWS